MTFESLAVAGLSIGLSMQEILDFNVGLVIGILNEKANQINDLNKKQKNNDEVIQGNAEMLMKM